MHKKFPEWLHKRLVAGCGVTETKKTIDGFELCTVCEEARCPNLAECYQQKKATLLLLGPSCTRSCRFCAVGCVKNPSPPDSEEPNHVAECVKKFGLRHVVLTMVTRDDLPDGGARHVASTLRAIRDTCESVTCEVLVSDFAGSFEAAKIILDEKPEVFSHNLETVRSLTPRIRSKATYETSLMLLSWVKKQNGEQMTKSGLMVGLGESREEVLHTIDDLVRASIDVITIGQYMQPTPRQIPVQEWISPETFAEYEAYATRAGITQVLSGPFVRSSYGARLP